ncbi:hypothetical protein KOW79_008229 [Hemibagrus wyckioides]|uniref:Uncharacterized protein n=1 Tax=Hemibagrus wyckioides TaxID=337641 RepID=A0A9D3NTC1_9TELE|nr:hypothetical protein KOW79_008229 [Hemibagrus wyckioides]
MKQLKTTVLQDKSEDIGESHGYPIANKSTKEQQEHVGKTQEHAHWGPTPSQDCAIVEVYGGRRGSIGYVGISGAGWIILQPPTPLPTRPADNGD